MLILHKIMDQVFSIRRTYKKAVIIAIDIFLLFSAFCVSLSLKQGELVYLLQADVLLTCVIATAITLLTLQLIGFYRTVARLVGFKVFLDVAVATFAAGCTAYMSSRYLFGSPLSASSTVIYMAFVSLFVGGFRLLVRTYFSYRLNTEKKRVIIYGAGLAGHQLVTSLSHGREFYPVAFIDDDESLHGTYIHGIKVYSSSEIEKIVGRYRPEKILLAIPRVSRNVRKKIINRLESLSVPVPVQTIPGLAELVEGKVKIDDVQDVSIDDLLGRDPVPPRKPLLRADIEGKAVMVTGAGGSIGSELCRQIIMQKPEKLILFELSEYSLYALDQELKTLIKERNLDVIVKPILGSVQNQNRVKNVISSFGIKTLYHAAAYKHVPMVEYNVVEGVHNNVFGTLRTAYAAIDGGVETFVLISTDKAVRPTNVMGATKRMAELLLQGLAYRKTNTRFCMVRFGNVLGSSGSVVPLFKKQIEAGGPLTVTHPDIIRYFMTIPEAAQLVIQAGALGMGGDVFVLDMGEPVKIADLARKMIHLMGFEVKDESNLDGDIEIQYSGLRPGEKLYEELLIGENVNETTHPLIMTANEEFLVCDELVPIVDKLEKACAEFDQETIREVLLEAPTQFTPSDEIGDLVWLKHKELASKPSL